MSIPFAQKMTIPFSASLSAYADVKSVVAGTGLDYLASANNANTPGSNGSDPILAFDQNDGTTYDHSGASTPSQIWREIDQIVRVKQMRFANITHYYAGQGIYSVQGLTVQGGQATEGNWTDLTPVSIVPGDDAADFTISSNTFFAPAKGDGWNSIRTVTIEFTEGQYYGFRLSLSNYNLFISSFEMVPI